eukprot:Pompholyxophrys_punicea_v1_NODE_589_length_1632_cov_10.899176.p1 type:complete len:364 gc:universal NODE_589_length_1632_cov_10.899176:496-1587(+)
MVDKKMKPKQSKQQANPIFQVVLHSQATNEVRLHAVYAAEICGYSLEHVAKIFGKDPTTIGRWVARFREEGHVERVVPQRRFLKFLPYYREWVANLINGDPLLFLTEIQERFHKNFLVSISVSSLWKIIHEAGFTKQVIERRALEISNIEVARFANDINLISPLPEQLCFLDEMSTDNRAMLRKRGWFVRGERPVYKSFFQRGSRISILTFLGVNGLFDTFHTEGTFDRILFMECCQKLLDSGKVQRFGGTGSVWVMDGAAIHCDASMIEYFFSRGIIIVFLSAYCPFFNPLEIVLGKIKLRTRAIYSDFLKGQELLVLFSVLKEFQNYDAKNIFRLCGFIGNGRFNPNVVDFKLVLKESDLN